VPPFQTFVDVHRATVYRFLMVAVGADDADDCFQETLLSALRAYPRLEHGDRLDRWILRIASRTAIDHHRASARRATPIERLPERAVADAEPPDDALWGAVRSLPPRQRVAVVLRHALDRPYAEVADALGIAEDAARLPDLAEHHGLLDVAIGELDSPIGELMVAVTPAGLACVAFEDEDRGELLARFTRELSPRILGSARATDGARRELDEYFTGRRTRFDLRVDRRLIGDFAWEVLRATRRVGFGRITTYGALAERVGRPRAARAVGNALGANPIPIVIPCHRVLRAGGEVGGYAGGPSRKRELLRLEGSLPR